MGWWGTHFGRNQTWYEPGKAWLAYIARSQALLQRGEPVADYLAIDAGTSLGANRADTISAQDFVADAAVKDDRITLPSGRTYAFALVPASGQMVPATARKLRELVSDGAVVAGPRPTVSPSLQDYPAADRVVAAVGARALGGVGNRGTRLRQGSGV